MILWNPNASRAGPTVIFETSVNKVYTSRGNKMKMKGKGGKVRTVHLDPALPFFLFLGIPGWNCRASRGYGVCGIGSGRLGRSGSRRGRCAPDWGKELDEDVGIEGERGTVGLVGLVGGMSEQFHDGEGKVVGRWEKVRYLIKTGICN